MTPRSTPSLREKFFAKNPGLEPVLELMAATPTFCVFVKDLQYRYILSNAMHLSTYDMTDDSGIIGLTARDFFPPLLSEAYEASDLRVFESGQSMGNEVWLIPHIRGTPRWFVVSKAPLYDVEGSIIGLVGLMRPIATPEDQSLHFQELQRVIQYLESNFVDEITVEKLAHIAGISPPHFNRRFRQLLRLSPMAYVLSLRIQEAQRRLVTSDQSVGDIAAAIGFFDQSHFTKRFRKITGMTPLTYRKRFRE
ncbi:MAG: AraC family transcriptional regulator [Verrucomicrobiota bacterium]